MIRALLAATALTTSMSMAALAQDTDTSTEMDAEVGTEMDAQVEAPMDSDAAMDADTDMDAMSEAEDMVDDDMSAESSVSLSAGYMQSDNDFLGSRILGATVWASNAEDADEIGDINDVIFNQNGRMIAAVIGIGGFLEIGEKSVAVGFEELEWTNDANGEPRLVLTGATYEALEAAPEFVWETPELAADPMMTDMETDGALDADAMMEGEAEMSGDPAMDTGATMDAEGDVETDAMMDAEGDAAMDTDADTPAAEMDAEVDAEADVNG